MAEDTKNETTDETSEETPETSDAAEATEAPAQEVAAESADAGSAVAVATGESEEALAEAAGDEAKEGGKRRRRRGKGKPKKAPKEPRRDLVQLFQNKYLRTDIPEFRAGDTVRVYVKIQEGDKQRLQLFEGVCIARKHGGANETFTVRKISAASVGVERTFYLHSQRLDRIERVRKGVVRRAKIYYLRNLRGKAARIRERRD